MAWSGEGGEAVTGGEQGGLGRKASQVEVIWGKINDVTKVQGLGFEKSCSCFHATISDVRYMITVAKIIKR